MLRSLLRSASARVIALPITGLAVILQSYIVIAYAGASIFGWITLLGTLFLLIPFADLGLGAAVVNSVARMTQSAEARDEALAIAKTVTRRLVALGAAGFAILALAAHFRVLAPMVGLPNSGGSEPNLATFTALAPLFVSLPFGVGQRILLGAGKNHVTALLAASGSLFALALTAGFIWAEAPPLFLGSALPLGNLAASVIMFALGCRIANWSVADLLTRPRSNTVPARTIWASAAPMLVVVMATAVGLQSGRVILGHLGSPTELSEYALAFQFFSPAMSVVTTSGAALWPIFARAEAQKLRRSWTRALEIMVGLGALVAVTYLILCRPIGALVSSQEILLSLPLAGLLSALLLAIALHQPQGMLLTSPRGLTIQAFTSLAMAALSVGLGILLAPQHGAVGVTLGALVGVICGQLLPNILLVRRSTK
ncbi:hypothetical protein [Microbacterium sp. NPDC096154]|uniref:lipopolysaccharide biosynthesis protein n=1 Tax=Microbacterium sp. NPDC096154 TaxID=3155549 RepID=UPI0033310C67